MVKDLGIGMNLALEQFVPVPLCAAGQQLWRAAALRGGKGASISEMVRWVEDVTQVTPTPGSDLPD